MGAVAAAPAPVAPTAAVAGTAAAVAAVILISFIALHFLDCFSYYIVIFNRDGLISSLPFLSRLLVL